MESGETQGAFPYTVTDETRDRLLSLAMQRTVPLFSCIAAIILLSGCAALQTPVGDLAAPSRSAPVVLALDPTCVRSTGGVTEFRREQFITIHASPIEGGLRPEDYRFLDELEVSYGREGGSRTWARSQTPADPKRPDFPDLDALRARGASARAKRKAIGRDNPAQWREMILCTHPEHYCPWVKEKKAPWGPSSAEGAAEFTANYLKEYYDDESRPRYLEVLNEPMVKLKKIGGTSKDVSELHVVVAKRVKELCPEVLVGGYTSAYPSFEDGNFNRWDWTMKTFIDIAGSHMDFFSIHVYDHVTEDTRKTVQRTGSNQEALLDIIDAYSYLKLGVAKPHIVSEYGGNTQRWLGPYSAARDAWMLRSLNGQTMVFMKHPDRYLKVVPFTLTRGLWAYPKPDVPYPYIIWRKSGKGYVTTEHELYYRFWKGIKGQWRRADSTDPDVLCHLLADGQRLNLTVMNIEEEEPRTVALSGLGELSVDKVALRTLRTNESIPMLQQRTLASLPAELTLAPGEAAVLLIDVIEPPATTQTELVTRHYAESYLHEIEADKPITFQFRNLPVGEGEAVLRLGIGREKDKSLSPVVKLGDRTYPPVADLIGDGQQGRPRFFGVVEVPIPLADLSATADVQVIFPDAGGKVASAVLQISRVEVRVPAQRASRSASSRRAS